MYLINSFNKNTLIQKFKCCSLFIIALQVNVCVIVALFVLTPQCICVLSIKNSLYLLNVTNLCYILEVTLTMQLTLTLVLASIYTDSPFLVLCKYFIKLDFYCQNTQTL